MLRSSVVGKNATEVTNTPFWPNIHLGGRSSTDQLDQSASHAELIISVCPSIDVEQTVDIPPIFFTANCPYADLSIKIKVYQAMA